MGLTGLLKFSQGDAMQQLAERDTPVQRDILRGAQRALLQRGMAAKELQEAAALVLQAVEAHNGSRVDALYTRASIPLRVGTDPEVFGASLVEGILGSRTPWEAAYGTAPCKLPHMDDTAGKGPRPSKAPKSFPPVRGAEGEEARALGEGAAPAKASARWGALAAGETKVTYYPFKKFESPSEVAAHHARTLPRGPEKNRGALVYVAAYTAQGALGAGGVLTLNVDFGPRVYDSPPGPPPKDVLQLMTRAAEVRAVRYESPLSEGFEPSLKTATAIVTSEFEDVVKGLGRTEDAFKRLRAATEGVSLTPEQTAALKGMGDALKKYPGRTKGRLRALAAAWDSLRTAFPKDAEERTQRYESPLSEADGPRSQARTLLRDFEKDTHTRGKSLLRELYALKLSVAPNVLHDLASSLDESPLHLSLSSLWDEVATVQDNVAPQRYESPLSEAERQSEGAFRAQFGLTEAKGDWPASADKILAAYETEMADLKEALAELKKAVEGEDKRAASKCNARVRECLNRLQGINGALYAITPTTPMYPLY